MRITLSPSVSSELLKVISAVWNVCPFHADCPTVVLLMRIRTW